MIVFTCPSCSARFSVDDSLAGRAADCSACGKPLVIPAHAEASDEDRVTSEPAPDRLATRPADSDKRWLEKEEEPYPDIRRRDGGPAEADLTPGDWLLCIFCSGIGCIVGIVRLVN